ncbi:hypothetical protein COCON_G00188140 [Conger conger]|uniref:Uncharacterized protein n=1 Tax=Conger conger TaxID=82655 RepID=A0A9Q1D398_CONCO|nr:hypothetical protein COCON_G00188140 [Conger conger]
MRRLLALQVLTGDSLKIFVFCKNCSCEEASQLLPAQGNPRPALFSRPRASVIGVVPVGSDCDSREKAGGNARDSGPQPTQCSPQPHASSRITVRLPLGKA